MQPAIHEWQTSDYEHLVSLNTSLPHALLIHGAKGLGKRILAETWIKKLLCHEPNQNTISCACQSCTLLQQDAHPDLLHLQDESDDETKKTKSITVNQIRAAVEFLSLSPHLSKVKIVLIEDMGLLGLNSANALLKILEEPPAYALFVLVTDNLSQVLPTIVSRCHKFKVSKPSANFNYNDLTSNQIFNAEFWLNYYEGSPLFELAITQTQFELLIATLSTPSINNIYTLTKEFDGKIVSFDFFVTFMLKWLSDLLLYKLSGQFNYFSQYSKNFDPLIPRVNMKQAFYLHDQLSFLAKWTNHPLNYKLQIENLMLQYQLIFSS